MSLVHFFNQSLWWFSYCSTFGPTRSRGGRSRCAWRLHWLWFFRWGSTAFGTGRSNAFSRLIRCNFDRARLSHSRARGVLKYIVSMSPPIPSIFQLDLKGSRWCLLYDSTSLPLPSYNRWSHARTLSPTAMSLYFANLTWLDFINQLYFETVWKVVKMYLNDLKTIFTSVWGIFIIFYE